MRRIDRKKADPEILAAYEELRYERRYPHLQLLVYILRIAGYGGFIPIFFLPPDTRLSYGYVWVIVMGIALIMEFTLMVVWQPRGRRLRTALLIIGTLIVAAVLLVASLFGLLLLIQHLS